MTMCELVIFGVTCGARRYDRTVTVTPQHCLVHNAKRAWLVGWYLCRSLSLAHCTCSFLLCLDIRTLATQPAALDARVGSRLF
jgi:hypothetical protein